MFMWTTIVNSLSQVADHPMSSPCWVDGAGPVLAYRTMHLNDVAPASTIFLLKKKRYSSCRYNERQLIDVTVVRRVRPRAERSCNNE